MKVLFVGSNPSNASSTNEPFHPSTKSYKTVMGWMSELGPVEFEFTNVANVKKENNKPLTVSEIKENLPHLQAAIRLVGPDRIVALGRTASSALTLLRTPFYELPHPSGMNRLLNSPDYIAQKLKGLEEFLKPKESTNTN